MTPDELLSEHVDEIVELSNELRALAMKAMPGAEERVYAGWHGFGYVHPDAGYVVGVFPGAGSVKVLFEHGHLLQDGERVFTGGTGQTRYVELESGQRVPAEAIMDLIADAIELRSVG